MWKKIYIENKETIYSVNEKGQVRNDVRKRLLKTHLQYGYERLSLKIGDKYMGLSVHRLVAEAFLSNPKSLPIVNHKDSNRHNNNVENLEWCSYSENAIHAHRNKRIVETREVNQYTLNGVFLWKYNSITDAANQTGSLGCKITEVCQRHRKSTNQYQWRYTEDEQDVYINYNPPTLPRRVGQYREGVLLNTFNSFREAAEAVNGSDSAICRICSGINKTHKGYEWKVVEDIVQELE